MRITIGSFELDNRFGFFIRLPYLGQGHHYPGLGWTWSWWSELKATGEV